MSIELVRELAGVWSRPFVVDGDPFDVEVAIIGLNPATEIKVSEVSRETFHELLLKRRLFEDFYEKRRRAAGKASMSRTRQWLRLLVSGYGGRNITEAM